MVERVMLWMREVTGEMRERFFGEVTADGLAVAEEKADVSLVEEMFEEETDTIVANACADEASLERKEATLPP